MSEPLNRDEIIEECVQIVLKEAWVQKTIEQTHSNSTFREIASIRADALFGIVLELRDLKVEGRSFLPLDR